MTRRFVQHSVIFVVVLLLLGCGGIRYSQVMPEAKDVHPQRIGIIPVDVGTYEEARGTIDELIAGALANKKWFTDIVAAETINKQIAANEELRKAMMDYITKMKAVNYSDPELSKKIGETIQVDAFLLVNLDFWGYVRENNDKIAKVGLGIKMIDAKTGKPLWKAGHHAGETYMLFKPKLSAVAEDLIDDMLDYMPH